jgi:predicted Zn finger-like uncharacterized protein
MAEAMRFKCLNCDARYKVVRVEAPPTEDQEVTCVRCGTLLQSRDGKYALKYFLSEGPGRRGRRHS